MLTFGSACSGIEAASVAWLPLGWRALWLAEIDKDASALLAYRYVIPAARPDRLNYTWWDDGPISQTLDAVLAKGQTMPEKNRFEVGEG